MKNTVRKFRKEQKIKGTPTVNELLHYAETQNYTVLSYAEAGALCPPESKKNVPAYTARIGETYYLFYNAALPKKDLIYALSHEAGHIRLNHMFSKRGAFDTVIHKEQEANRFAVLLTRPGNPKKHLYCIAAAVLALSLLCTPKALPEEKLPPAVQGFAKTVYITPNGTKYHTASCPHIKSRKTAAAVKRADAEEKNYTPCKDCME